MARINNRKLKTLNDQEERFINNLLNPAYGRDRDGLRQAYVDAGYKDCASALPNAHQKSRDLHDHIVLRMNDRISCHVPWAFDKMVELAETAKNETVKLKALESILTRAGYNAPIVIENHSSDPKEMPREQIAKEIKMLLERSLGIKPELKLVEGGKKEG